MMMTMITYMTTGGHAVSVRHVHGADADVGRHQFGRTVDVLGVGLPALPRLLGRFPSLAAGCTAAAYGESCDSEDI